MANQAMGGGGGLCASSCNVLLDLAAKSFRLLEACGLFLERKNMQATAHPLHMGGTIQAVGWGVERNIQHNLWSPNLLQKFQTVGKRLENGPQ